MANCDSCGKTLSPIDIGDGRILYEGIVCLSCGLLQCKSCKGTNVASPCQKCNNEVKPAYESYLAKRPVRSVNLPSKPSTEPIKESRDPFESLALVGCCSVVLIIGLILVWVCNAMKDSDLEPLALFLSAVGVLGVLVNSFTYLIRSSAARELNQALPSVIESAQNGDTANIDKIKIELMDSRICIISESNLKKVIGLHDLLSKEDQWIPDSTDDMKKYQQEMSEYLHKERMDNDSPEGQRYNAVEPQKPSGHMGKVVVRSFNDLREKAELELKRRGKLQPS